MLKSEWMIIGNWYSGVLEEWEGNFKFPFVLRLRTSLLENPHIRTFASLEQVEQFLDEMDAKRPRKVKKNGVS
jgi:hypothetical protein